MKSCGIIAEYNPFHKGHIYHIEQTKKMTDCDCLVVIVSGLFSQRGLPSLLTRYDKANLALQYGANLVLELPAVYACQSADYFAKYALQSLSSLHIDSLCFGSECNDIEALDISVDSPVNHKVSLNQNLQLQLEPNDILGMQYVKYCKEYGIKPYTIQRNNTFKSATQTRHDAYHSAQDFQEYFHLEQSWNSYYPYLRTFLQLSDASLLASYFLVNEGIENRLKEAARLCNTWDSFLSKAVTKTYTKARIQRTCMMILLQVYKKDMENPSFFQCKVLGFDSIGQRLLKECRDSKIYTRFSDLDEHLKSYEYKENALYNSISANAVNMTKVIYYDR